MANWLSVNGYNEFAKTAKRCNQLSTVWEEETPHARFWKNLVNYNIGNMINDPDKFILKHLRYDHEMLKRYEGHFGEALAKRGLTFHQLIAEAYGENWDFGGKSFHASNQRNHDDLDRAREIGIPKRQIRGDVVQGSPQGRRKNLEKERQGLVKEV